MSDASADRAERHVSPFSVAPLLDSPCNPGSLDMTALHSDIIVYTPYYAARTPERQAELDQCLQANLACDSVTRLVLLVDDGHEPPVSHPKLIVRHVPSRPTYRDWVELSRSLAIGQISILANSDIYFDDSLGRVRETLSESGRLLALTRFEKVGERLEPHANPSWSQDVWGVRGGIPLPAPLLKALEIPLGVPRCDNKVAYLFAVHGWTVHNPFAFVRTVHMHETQQRNYDKKADLTVVGCVAYVEPASALAQPSNLRFDVWTRNAHLVEEVKINKSLDVWLKKEASGSPSASAPTAVSCVPPWTNSPVPGTEVADLSILQRVLAERDCVFAAHARFRVHRFQGQLVAIDRFAPSRASWLGPDAFADGGSLPAEALLTAFVPPVAETPLIRVQDRPSDVGDCQFWQYPAATEQQALDNHRSIPRGANVDRQARVVHTYLGLPWATYIDKKRLPDEVPRRVGLSLRSMHSLAVQLGYTLRVHTVCQQIYWRRLVPTWLAMGVTDLHLSHAEKAIDPLREGGGLQVHSWPLFAPNIEVAARRDGLVIGRPVADKRYLASFIGAHMPHYRSDVRLRLRDAALAAGRDDLLVEVTNEWHFNKTVYVEQVQNRALQGHDHAAQRTATLRYNEVLADSIFSLCPEGAGPNTLRFWESLAAGAIPVVLAPSWTPPSPLPGQVDLRTCALFVADPPDTALFARLAAIPRDECTRMQRACIALYEQCRRRRAFGH